MSIKVGFSHTVNGLYPVIRVDHAACPHGPYHALPIDPESKLPKLEATCRYYLASLRRTEDGAEVEFTQYAPPSAEGVAGIFEHPRMGPIQHGSVVWHRVSRAIRDGQGKLLRVVTVSEEGREVPPPGFRAKAYNGTAIVGLEPTGPIPAGV